MSRIPEWIARTTVRRPAILVVAAALALALSLALIRFFGGFDSDILNLLPSDSPAVKGLKIYNERFAQNRELTFVLTWEKPPQDAETAVANFAALIQKEPWAIRTLQGSPMESPDGDNGVEAVLVPLLLNLPPEKFREATALLTPGNLEARLTKLASQAAAGSPRAQLELTEDPLGLAALAAGPVINTVSISDTFDLVSPDGTTYVIPVATNQPNASPEACRAMMESVRSFLDKARTSFGKDAPEVLVTGRSAYVDEISRSMRSDLSLTSIVSLFVVILLFWIGFRALFPLAGIALILSLAGVVTLAVGMLLLGNLNVLAMAFCSILFGVGDDFSLLLCQRYFHNRNAGLPREEAIAETLRHVAPGIFWVALTTGLGFLALWFSGSVGFSQLGTLVAIGVFTCSGMMMLFIFLFLRHAPASAAKAGPALNFATSCFQSPERFIVPTALLSLVILILAAIPWRIPQIDLSPSSLEPRNTPAAEALSIIMEKFPAAFEPALVVVENPTPDQLAAVDSSLKKAREAGLLQSSSSPSALVLDNDRLAANAKSLQFIPFDSLVSSLPGAADRAGLSAEAVEPALKALNQLHKISEPKADWAAFLPQHSSWWFLLDRMISPDSSAAIAYLRTKPGISTEERQQLEKLVNAEAPQAIVSGWSQTLASLLPWASHELTWFGGAVALIIAAVLFAAYRDFRYWLLHVASLVLSIAGIVITLKLTGVKMNLLNLLAFPLILGVGVDYGTHLILAARSGEGFVQSLSGVIKPVALSGLTTITGFGALVLARNPALNGLGFVCAIGVAWCLVYSLLLVVPGCVWIARRSDNLLQRSP